jgi:hypothetical protein
MKNTRVSSVRSNRLSFIFSIKHLILLVYFLFTALTNAEEKQTDIFDKPVLDIFVREGCPHCTEAKNFLPILIEQYPQLHIVVHSIDQDVAAQE